MNLFSIVRSEEAGGSNPLSSTIFQNDLERAKQFLPRHARTKFTSSLPDSFRYLVIHPERHCLSAASSVKTSRFLGTDPDWRPFGRFRIADVRSWELSGLPSTTHFTGGALRVFRGYR